MRFGTIGVVGGGAWGTALACSLATAGKSCRLWAYETETVREIEDHRTNRVFLPNVTIPDNLGVTAKLSDIADCSLILLVPPAQHLGRIVGELSRSLDRTQPLVVCAKGIERASNRLLGDVLDDVAPSQPQAFLSGPSFAADVARNRPVALTVGSDDEDLGEEIARTIGSPRMRVYWTSDTIGVQVGGAVKNVLAIAAGIVDGLELGASAHAALVTRGFAEMRRFGTALGARPETLGGLSGLGDLLLTCGSPQSRNMSLGRALGHGKIAADVLGARAAVTEGVFTASAMVSIAKQHGIEAPIAEAVHAVVEGELAISEAIDGLLQRPMKSED
ncbi:MAG: NAD(P)H-dependent glycerol-3-phosphate dehydrogenase [Pseudomonadota bacterium]